MAGYGKWAELPKEILEIFAKHLDSRIDVFRFRAVCSSWRSAASPSHLQHSLSPLFTLLRLRNDYCTSCVPLTICCLQSQTETEGSSSLVKVFEKDSGELYLINPLYEIDGDLFNPFYRYTCSDLRGKTVNLLNFRLIELYKGYELHFGGEFYKKRIFSGDCCKILGIKSNGKIGFQETRYGLGWNKFGSDETRYDDIIAYKGQCYVVDSRGIVYWINMESMNLVQYSPPLPGGGQLKNLIESNGCLYVVDSYVDLERWRKVLRGWEDQDIDRVDTESVRTDMKVYMFAEQLKTWVYVESLGDRIFVLGNEYSFAFSARDIPGCEGNCIYFLENPARDISYYAIWVFRLDDRSIRNVLDLPKHIILMFLPSLNWSFSNTSSP